MMSAKANPIAQRGITSVRYSHVPLVVGISHEILRRQDFPKKTFFSFQHEFPSHRRYPRHLATECPSLSLSRERRVGERAFRPRVSRKNCAALGRRISDRFAGSFADRLHRQMGLSDLESSRDSSGAYNCHRRANERSLASALERTSFSSSFSSSLLRSSSCI